ncbi:MAG: TOTE conflict system archaeo-eukaryotic primase domain-containing protein, partial [Erysipelotrichaceae bacterium]
MNHDQLKKAYFDLQKEYEALLVKYEALLSRVEQQHPTSIQVSNTIVDKVANEITQHSRSDDKVALFLSLFQGRSDVCAKRWKAKAGYSPYCFNDFKAGICEKPRVKCMDCKHQNFANYNMEQVVQHLLGNIVLGLYPLLTDDTCHLLVLDFDKAHWQEEIQAIQRVCSKHDIPVAIERSRSGNGAHAWFFFEEAIPARKARGFGMYVLTQAMHSCTHLTFASFDRMFPSQDVLQQDGFGNLIALPLQKEARTSGNSVFIDEHFQPYPDQWNFLFSIKRLSVSTIQSFQQDQSFDYQDKKRVKLPSLKPSDVLGTLNIEEYNGLHISKSQLNARSIYALRRLCSYANPEFYAKQAMRLTTYQTPKVVEVYEEDEFAFILPRGVKTALEAMLQEAKIPYLIQNNRKRKTKLNINFLGILSEHQQVAFQALNKHEDGVLSATTGFGKTVLAASLIASKQCSTLVLVHTKELLNQWLERLDTFLVIDEPLEKKRKNTSIIGVLGGGKQRLHGYVDVAMMQSLFEKDKSLKELIHNYDMVIVDECHHVSAAQFSRILQQVTSTYVYGLTATPKRKDGHHPIIFHYLGPIRYQTNAKLEAKKRDFDHVILPRFTANHMPLYKEGSDVHISKIFQLISENMVRNAQIIDDIVQAVLVERTCLVLSERTAHVTLLAKMLEERNIQTIVLLGTLTTKQRNTAMESLKTAKRGYVLLATGKLIGEGFDDPRLDTLFITMPISWSGRVSQYVGRLHRNYEGKKEVQIYDYVDVHIPVLERMYQKRLSTYHSLGYYVKDHIPMELETEKRIFTDQYQKELFDDFSNAKHHIVLSFHQANQEILHKLMNVLLGCYRNGVYVTVLYQKLDIEDEMMPYVEDSAYQGLR